MATKAAFKRVSCGLDRERHLESFTYEKCLVLTLENSLPVNTKMSRKILLRSSWRTLQSRIFSSQYCLLPLPLRMKANTGRSFIGGITSLPALQEPHMKMVSTGAHWCFPRNTLSPPQRSACILQVVDSSRLLDYVSASVTSIPSPSTLRGRCRQFSSDFYHS